MKTILAFLLVPLLCFKASAQIDSIPAVHCVVIRVDYMTDTIKGICEFSQPFRKTLPPEEMTPAGNIYYRYMPASDFGYTEIRSRFTGQQILYASTVWSGTGILKFPSDSLFKREYTHGFVNPPPDSLQYLPLFAGKREDADTIWNSVKDLDAINRLSSYGPYGVMIVNHFYSVGAGNPYSAEWFLIAYSKPVAPVDVSVEKILWPKKLITRNVPSNAEYRIHNFSDAPVELSVRFVVNDLSGNTLIQSSKDISLQGDSSTDVSFPYVIDASFDSLRFRCILMNRSNAFWKDAFSDNNSSDRYTKITDHPLFRPVSSIRHPGPIPTRGDLIDVNGDGKLDIFQYGYKPRLLLNDSAGGFIDITHRISVPLPGNPRMSIAEDFNGDALQDMIIVSFENPPLLLLGNGKGDFTDFTAGSGLSQHTGYWFTLAVDLDNDGSKDLIIQSYDQEKVLRNDGKGHFSDMTAESGLIDPAQTQSISAGDLNNDGYPEIFFTNWNASPTLFRNNGNGTFTLSGGPWNFIYSRMATIVDLNGDGLKDIVVARFLYDDKSLIFMNLGNMTFANAAAPEKQVSKSLFCDAADINNDGRPDLIMDQLESFSLLLNDGDHFSDHTELLVDMKSEMLFGALGASATPRFVDLNGDGLLDIYSQQIVFINQGCNTKANTGIERQDSPPFTFSLSQNYPNPFNPGTTIEYQISYRQLVSVRIYDLLGREVASLVNEEKDPGRYSVVWDASRYAAGIYVARMQSGVHAQIKKMLYLK